MSCSQFLGRSTGCPLRHVVVRERFPFVRARFPRPAPSPPRPPERCGHRLHIHRGRECSYRPGKWWPLRNRRRFRAPVAPPRGAPRSMRGCLICSWGLLLGHPAPLLLRQVGEVVIDVGGSVFDRYSFAELFQRIEEAPATHLDSGFEHPEVGLALIGTGTVDR